MNPVRGVDMNLKDRLLRVRLFLLKKRFPGSNLFWINEYKTGGNSGPGSYGELANFKAKVLNHFVNLAAAMETNYLQHNTNHT